MSETPMTEGAIILHPRTLPAVDRGNGVGTIPLVTLRRGATSFLNGITTFAPGAAIRLHTHNCAESVMIIEGEAVVEVDGTETSLATFDTTFVAGGIPHRFRNASELRPMRILWTYASVHATRTFCDTGATARIDEEHETDERD